MVFFIGFSVVSRARRSFENVYAGFIIHSMDFTNDMNLEITVYNCTQNFFLKKKNFIFVY